ncbi:MAG: endonuclease/exonuclease/phosphatase family protein, partial [Vagococcus fluvialis]
MARCIHARHEDVRTAPLCDPVDSRHDQSDICSITDNTTRGYVDPAPKENTYSFCTQGHRVYTSNSKNDPISTVINKTFKANDKYKRVNRDTTDDIKIIESQAIIKQRQYLFFQTVNHAKVVWDPVVKPKGFFGGHLNIRSLFPKCDEIRILLLGSNLDFLCISETWLNDRISTSMIDVPGYKCYRKDRVAGRGGGVLIYIKDCFMSKEVQLDGTVSIESLCINVALSPRMTFNILVVYRPPSSCPIIFYECLGKMLKGFKQNSEVLLFGDFNINWMIKSERKQLKEITQKYDFYQQINGPTRITKKSQTAIDLIFTNKPERVIKTYNLICGLSDHNMILISRKLTKQRLNEYKINQKVSKLIIPQKNQPKLENDLINTNWDDILQNNQVNNCCDLFTITMREILDKFLIQCKRPQRKIQLPWVNDAVRQLIKKRDFALKTFFKTRHDTDLFLYKGLRNRVVKELRNSKSNYYMKMFADAKGNSKLIWKHINSLTNFNVNKNHKYEIKIGERNISDPVQVANAFNQYFFQSVHDLASKFSDDETNHKNISSNPIADENFFTIKEVDEAVVLKVISDLNATLSRDIYNMDVVFLKK